MTSYERRCLVLGMEFSNTPLPAPLSRLRPQIQDLVVDNIADLAVRAREMKDVITL